MLANMKAIARGDLTELAPDQLGGQFMVVRGILLKVVRNLGSIVMRRASAQRITWRRARSQRQRQPVECRTEQQASTLETARRDGRACRHRQGQRGQLPQGAHPGRSRQPGGLRRRRQGRASSAHHGAHRRRLEKGQRHYRRDRRPGCCRPTSSSTPRWRRRAGFRHRLGDGGRRWCAAWPNASLAPPSRSRG